MTANVNVTSQNNDALYRFDRDKDGTISGAEVRQAREKAALPSLVEQEWQTLNPEEKAALSKLADHNAPPLQLRFSGSSVGQGAGKVSWDDVEARLTAAAQSQPAAPATLGQGRPGSLDNYDCGQTTALYLGDRRLQAVTGRAPATRTHAQVDEVIRSQSHGPDSGTGPTAMGTIMNQHYSNVGGTQFVYRKAAFSDAANLERVVRAGLATDPAGVLVPIYSRTDKTDEGSPHWIAVTSIEPGGKVHYYNPGGVDGANHEFTMTLAELRGAAAYTENRVGVVAGVRSDTARGNLPVGSRVGQESNMFINDDLRTVSSHGAYGTRAAASQRAQEMARQGGSYVVVNEEHNNDGPDEFVVYKVGESLDSDAEFTRMSPRVTDIVWKDGDGATHAKSLRPGT